MCLPYPCKLAEEMVFDEFTATREYEQDQLVTPIDGQPLEHPVIVTQVASKKDGQPHKLMLSSLKQILDGENAKKMNRDLGLQSQEGNLLHRCRFSVNAIVPFEENKKQDFSFLKFYNTKTGASRDFSAKSDKPKANEKLCIFLQLLCKDSSIQYTDEFVRVTLMQDSDDGFFKGINPQDLIAPGKKG